MSNGKQRPRVGIPYRTGKEELSGTRGKYELYLRAVESAGGEPVEISLGLSSDELDAIAESVDAVVLPGSPADVDPSRYHASPRKETNEADTNRERTDYALLKNAFDEGKPVLAICYGVQLLNVYLGGTLIQDIPSEVHTNIPHERDKGRPEMFHEVQFETNSRSAMIAGANVAKVNSSHHQAILEPGRSLRIVGRAPDGVIEAVEWTGDANWVTGVQWHPERMTEDALAQGLFRDLITAARGAAIRA